jgi:PAS domain S-box-containing protein
MGDKKHSDRGLAAGKTFPFCGITSAVKSPCCTILESISDGVFTIDAKKRITSFNRAAQEITGFRQEETIGQYCFDIFRADICEKRCALDETLSSGKPRVNLPARIITKQGGPKSICISTAILRNEAREVIGGVETFRDLSEVEELRRHVTRRFTHDDIVGEHPKIREIISFLPDIAESDSAVLIEGPTGSGKELIARAIHNLSPRSEGPFIAVNCAALPDTLLESELFGYSKGAFTGAVKTKPGRFLLADGGTIFLDEISNTSLAFQMDLLRVLEQGELTPLGATKTLKADFRVVAATNVGLRKLVQAGKFREDLYYRLKVIRIVLPALRERKEDIPLLIDHFIHKFNIIKRKEIQGVSPEVLSFLMDYSFPGNIRELENIIEFAFVACKGPTIGLNHLPQDLFEAENRESGDGAVLKSGEVQRIQTILARYPNNRDEAARALGISRATLWRKMKKYGIIAKRE